MIFLRLGKNIRKHLGIYSLGAMVIGLAVGNMFQGTSLKHLIPFALFMMLYPPFLDTDISVVVKKTIADKKLLIIALLFNFIVSPLLMYGLLKLFSSGLNPDLIVGLLIFSAMPGGGMGPAYTGMINGNVGLCIAITAVSLLLSIIFMPLWTVLLIGKVVQVPAAVILKYLFMIIIIPAALATLSRQWLIRNRGERAFENIKEQFQNITGIGLILMLFIIFVLNGKFVLSNYSLIMKILFPAIPFSLLLLAVATLLARACQSDYKDSVAFSISVAAKNTAISMALATSVFHDLTALAIAIAGTFVQLPVMLIYMKIRPEPPE